MNCPRPLDITLLSDYWLGDLAEDQERVVEEHLFSCSSCNAALERFVELTRALSALAASGTLRVTVTESFLDELRRDGLRVREYSSQPGGHVQCTVTPADDFVVARLAADMSACPRIDLAGFDDQGREVLRLPDITPSAGRKEIVMVEPIDALRRLPKSVLVLRLFSVEPDSESVIGEYTFHHTPSQ